ncbi:hypothetical protein SAMN04487969_13417 [Paenibacillus algorifonticola]|uniref:Uncharacterized protein n=1 Tax=Paenibacillus algorifonticola TaxID=684063 RepID=A0A1I2ID54_9BACL|nr:hypothetical protein [Paenibacillus algorifonticola]SFF40225.1 hypothetical protein SAMN04487969_13417 [Paenibacillus algorifonticola]
MSEHERMDTYNQYVEQEDTFCKQLETLEQCQWAMFDHIFRYGEQFNRLMVEEVLMKVHQMEVNVRLELLHLRLEKAFLANDMEQH